MFGDDIFDAGFPDMNGDGRAGFIDSFLLNEMVNDTEELEQEELKRKRKQQNKKVKKPVKKKKD